MRKRGYRDYLEVRQAHLRERQALQRSVAEAEARHTRELDDALVAWVESCLAQPRQALADQLAARPEYCPMCQVRARRRHLYAFTPPLGGVLAVICESCFHKLWHLRYGRTPGAALLRARLNLEHYSAFYPHTTAAAGSPSYRRLQREPA